MFALMVILMKGLFGTNGVRGTFDDLGPALAMGLAQAFCAYCGNGKILVARDARVTGECLSFAVKSGIASAGGIAADLGVCSSPCAEYMVKHEKANGLIIVTASHNTPEWNALKFVDKNGITISRERGADIELLMEKPHQAKWDGVPQCVQLSGATGTHISALSSHADLEKIKKADLSVALDFGNGTACMYADMFRKICRATAINSHLDGFFPGRNSEPTEANISNLISLVKEGGFDLGLAWDGDADRLVAVDEKGDFVVGDKVFALCLKHSLGQMKGDIATTVSTSRAAEDVAAAFGRKTVYTRVGAPYLSEAMHSGKCAMAGEEVGGVIWKNLSLAKDGILTALKLMEICAEGKMSSHVSALPQYFNAKCKIAATGKEKAAMVARVAAHAKSVKGAKLTEIDGVRIDFAESWVIARASGTENYVRVFAEAKSMAEAVRIAGEYTKIAEGK
jgi:phosphomannomutase / phosphoglucomutase